MADVLDLIQRRRSVRKFLADAVPVELLDQLLQAAMAAPSASNRRPWEFLVVTDPAILAKLRAALVLGRYEAPACVVVCGNMLRSYPPPARDFWIQDCSAATENLLLAAVGLGLGAVWVGVYPIKPFMRGVARALGLPRHVRPLGLVHLGYPAETKPPRTQYDAARIHWQGWRKGEEDGA
jgi:nitroreductase